MVFNSVVFLFCFLPLSLLLYYLVPGRAKNAVLLAESLIFYCWTGVAFLPLIAVLIVFNYLWALLTARAKAKLRGLLPLAAVAPRVRKANSAFNTTSSSAVRVRKNSSAYMTTMLDSPNLIAGISPSSGDTSDSR